MNWIKENKFLFGLLIVVVIGVGVLGYFLFDAKGRYEAAVEDYQKNVGELNRLQKQPTFPNQKNLDRLVEQKQEVNNEVSALATALAAQQIPLEDMSPESFQDKLKAIATAVRNKAAQSNPAIKLPSEKFFLGFERYETAPPAKEAAAALGRELKAVDWLTNTLLDNRITELRKLDREELPEEKGRIRAGEKQRAPQPAAKPVPGKAGAGKGAAVAKDAVDHQVEPHRLEIVFITEQSRFRQIANAITGYSGQFFIIRTLSVKNEKQTAPSRTPAGTEGAPPPTADAAANAAGGAAAVSSYIVGEEKVEVTLVVEFVEFS